MNKKITAFITITSFTFWSVFAQTTEQGAQLKDLINGGPINGKVCLSSPSLNYLMSRGSIDKKTNFEVTLLQSFLKTNLNLTDQEFIVTGYFGRVTENFVKKFQKQNGLVVSGIVGAATRKKIAETCVPIITTPKPPETSTTTSAIVPVTTKYKDGTYSATTTYNSPGGQDFLGVTLNLKADKIIGAIITNGSGDGVSSNYQDRFIAVISPMVIGVPLQDLNIGVVSGASLTSRSFNEALFKIRDNASFTKAE